MNELPFPVRNCIEDGIHLSSCDDDGFCNHCGYQDNPDLDDEAIPTTEANFL